jgi:hypothetical protein
MKNILKLMGAALIVIFISSCSKSNETGISLKFKASTTLPAGAKAESVIGYTFTEAMLGIKKIEIKREDELLDDGDLEYDYNGNYVVDLLTATSTPVLGFSEFLPGTYNKFESETAPVLTGGKTISIKGSYTATGGAPVYFEFSSIEEFEFEFESDSGFVLTEGSVFDMLININLPLLFQGVDFSKATANVNGVFILNETTNNSIASLIKNNIDKVTEMEDEHESK